MTKRVSSSKKLNNLYLQEDCINIDEMYYKDLIKLETILEDGFFSDLYSKFKKYNKPTKSDPTIDRLKKAYSINIDLVKKYLLKQGVDVEGIKIDSEKVAKSIKKDFNERKDPQVIQDKIVIGIKKIVKNELTTLKSSFVEKSLSEKVIYSIIMFLIVFCINTIIFTILNGILFGLGSILLVVILGPIIEETAKRWAIKEDMPWVYTGIFAGLELIKYVFTLVEAGSLLIPTLILRISALMMHFSTTLIQKYFYDKDKEEGNISTENTEIGYILAIFIHVTWNVAAIIFNGPLNTFIGF
jgi:hypothetical protein